MDWFGRAKLSFAAAPSPLSLKEKDGTSTDLLKVCKEVVPPCQLNPLLFNGHLQTCFTAFKNEGPRVYYKRKIFNADHKEYDGTFAVDFISAPFEKTDETLPPRTAYYKEEEFANIASDDSKPMLVILHGLSGGSHEIYLRMAIEGLVLNNGGWEGCVVNSRGCAKSRITTSILYNARATWDMRTVVKWLRKTFPNRPLFGLGFSLGACILTNYLGEEGSNCELKAAMVCANPWNLEVSSKELQRTFIGKELYLRVLGTAMKELVREHEEDLKKNTKLEIDDFEKITYLFEFDRAVQCPTWGYPTEDAYYRDASSNDSIFSVRIPLLILNAEDDPIAVKAALPRNEVTTNPYTVLCTTSLGGHLGWFEIGGGRWHSRPVSNFFNHMAFKIDLDSIGKKGDSDITTKTFEAGASFDPMRRRMHVPIE